MRSLLTDEAGPESVWFRAFLIPGALRVSAPAHEVARVTTHHAAKVRLLAGSRVVGTAEAVVQELVPQGDLVTIDLTAPDIPESADTIEVSFPASGAWIYPMPRRGASLPGHKPLRLEPTAIAKAQENPFAVDYRPARPVADPQPLQSIAPGPRTVQIPTSEWGQYRISTERAVPTRYRRAWRVAGLLRSEAPNGQSWHQTMPVSGVAQILAESDSLVLAGLALAELTVSAELVDLQREYLLALDTGANRPIFELATALSRLGFSPRQLHQLEQSGIPIERLTVHANCDGFVRRVAPSGRLETGATICEIEIGRQFLFSGWVDQPASALPQFVDVAFTLGTADQLNQSRPLNIVRGTSTSSFVDIPVSVSRAPEVPAVVATMLDTAAPVDAVRLPGDCVMAMHKSKEILVRSGAFQLSAIPISVLDRTPQGDVVATGLGAGVSVVRDLSSLANSVGSIRRLMLGIF